MSLAPKRAARDAAPLARVRLRVGLADLNAFAKHSGGRCLAKSYVRAKDKVRWRCHAGHEWEATWDKVKQGSWCPTCRHQKATLTDMQDRAAAHGGKCLSPRYEGNLRKLTWQCSRGHVWQALPYKVLRNWCQKCAGLARRRTIEEMASLAKKQGGHCVSVRYMDSTTKLEVHVQPAAPVLDDSPGRQARQMVRALRRGRAHHPGRHGPARARTRRRLPLAVLRGPKDETALALP